MSGHWAELLPIALLLILLLSILLVRHRRKGKRDQQRAAAKRAKPRKQAGSAAKEFPGVPDLSDPVQNERFIIDSIRRDLAGRDKYGIHTPEPVRSELESKLAHHEALLRQLTADS